jgi:hypothetical protein
MGLIRPPHRSKARFLSRELETIRVKHGGDIGKRLPAVRYDTVYKWVVSNIGAVLAASKQPSGELDMPFARRWRHELKVRAYSEFVFHPVHGIMADGINASAAFEEFCLTIGMFTTLAQEAEDVNAK